MTSKSELIQQLCDNIFAGKVEISSHTRKTPIFFQVTRRDMVKRLKNELQKWEELKNFAPTSAEFNEQSELIYNLIIDGRNKFIVHGEFDIQSETESLRKEIQLVTDQRNKLAQDLGILPSDKENKKNKKDLLSAYG